MSSPFSHFEDFDQDDIYKRYEASLFKPSTLNVVIDFDNATSFASLNVDSDSVKKILQTKVWKTCLGAVTSVQHEIY